MAVAIAPGQIKRFALSANANTATEITYSARVRRIKVHFVKPNNDHDQDGKVALTGTDNAAIVADHLTVHGDEHFDHVLAPGRALSQPGSIFAASATASAIVEVIAYGA
jgi:hypothetical protein